MSTHRSVAIFERGRRGLNNSICTLLNSSPWPCDNSRRRGAVAKLQMFCAERRYCDNTHACSLVVNFNYFSLLLFPFRVSNFSADGSQVDGRSDSAWSVEAAPVILNALSGDQS